MAKKNSSQSKTNSAGASTTGTARSRSRAPRTSAPESNPSYDDIGEPTHTAADMSAAGGGDGAASDNPSYDEIAEAAYQRYLRRGEQHGGDFDDWVEAERELRSRRTRQ